MPRRPRARTQGPRRTVGYWVKSLVIPVAIFLVVRTFIVEAFHIYPSGSMERTLLIGDFLFVNKALYGAEIPFVGTHLPGLRQPRRSDLVIFRSVEDPHLAVVKRVIGVPGDTIEMRHNVVWLNGERLAEPYVERRDPATDPVDARMRRAQLPYLIRRDPRTYRPSLKNWGPLVIPPDSLFVMGDNRDDSYDSRYWGILGRDRIKGSPFLVYYSYDRNGLLPLPFLTSIRWRRLLTVPH